MSDFKSESRLTFMEATSIIVGHGVGAGILSVPFLASRNSIFDFIWIIVVAYVINLIEHLMIAELSYNNGGAQFITCLDRELFIGKLKNFLTWLAFIVLGVAEIVKVSGFITGAAAALQSWFGISAIAAMVIYYILVAIVVYAGMKIVGICEKISVYAMIGVIGILVVATFLSKTNALPSQFVSTGNIMALYSIVAFALSAVMSVPQVVKGLNGDVKKIRGAIAAGTGINLFLIIIITIITLIGAGTDITKNGALVDLSAHLGGWVSIIGYLFTLLALSTSFWACTLNLRDIISEKTSLNIKLCWLIATLPCLLLALTGSSFVTLTRISSAASVLLGIAVILAYSKSRKKSGNLSPICGKFGSLPFQIIVVLSTLIATIGSLISVK